MSVTTKHRREASPRARRLLAAIPALILLVAFGALAITKTDAVSSALKSGRALLLIAGFSVVWLLLSRFVLPRFVRSVAVRSALLGAIAVAVVGLAVVPYFRNHEVVEAFPTTVSRRDNAPLDTATESDAPAEPVRLSGGSLRGIDHSATGAASVYRRPDGTAVVELKDIDIQSGPDYFVHLVRGLDREDPEGGTNLGALRGNQGTQYYEVPAATAFEGDWTVLIWCRSFGVPVANATQRAV